MTRAPVFAAMTAAFLLHSGLSAQINNYYNAPYQYQLPGHPAAPGVTPFVGGTTQPVTYPYNTASSAVQPAGYPYNATGYGAQPYTTTSTYATPGTAATVYPQSYTVPGTATTTAYPQTYTAPTYGTSAYSTANANYYPNAYPGTTTTTGNISTAFSSPLTATGQIYPQPAQPSVAYQPTAAYTPLAVPVPAYAEVAPPDFWSPGLATIKNGKWVVTDFLYNLSPNIGVKVQVVRPPNRYLPLSDKLMESKITTQFQDALLNPTALIIPCQPPLPVYNITIMAYPCGNRCVGVVTAQLYETARPDRIEADLAGVWQVVTWERQELVVSSCEDFAQQIEMTIVGMTQAFIDLYNRFNPIPTRQCFAQ